MESPPPNEVVESAGSSTGLRRLLFSSSWLLADRMVRLLLGLALNIVLARALGPATFGDFAFALAMAARLPTIFHWAEIVHDGALLAYGVSLAEAFRLIAGQVARILGDTRPADIPVEQPTRIALTVNLRVARALGIAIPQTLLARADEVIE